VVLLFPLYGDRRVGQSMALVRR